MEPESSLPYSQMPATCPDPEPDQSSPDPHIPLSEDPFNIIIPFTPGCPKSSLFLRFPHRNPVWACPLSHTFYVPRPTHYSRFDHPNDIWWAVHIIKLFIMWFSQLSCYPVPLRPKCSSQYPVFKLSRPEFLSPREGPNFSPIQNRKN